MRRPVKPFVTEYRGGARRQAGTPGQGLRPDPTRLEPERSEPRVSEPWPSQSPSHGRSSSLPQEDGYEAALRAADALFSVRSHQPNAASASASSAAGEVAEPGTQASSPAAGGRILRAIDEPPSPELLRLEAEFAPKRRGRKPGSKNKPKVSVPAMEAAVALAADPVMVAPPSIHVMERSVVRQASQAALPATSAAAVGPKGDRYAWVRTKLKPGQQWKRRLPKVAW